jgi:hypothetical protein
MGARARRLQAGLPYRAALSRLPHRPRVYPSQSRKSSVSSMGICENQRVGFIKNNMISSTPEFHHVIS